MEEWNIDKLGNLCKRVCSGGTPKSTCDAYYGGGIPWLNTKEVDFNRIYSTAATISQSGLDNSSAKWVEKNAVIVAMYGNTAGKVALSMIPLTTNQACCNLTIDEKKADYRYIYYYLCSQYVAIKSKANGAAQQNLNAQQIKDLDIPLPPLEVQNRIADILFSIDDKIELNNRINHNLEQQGDILVLSLLNGECCYLLNELCELSSKKVDSKNLAFDNYISTDNMIPLKGGVAISSQLPTGKFTEFLPGDTLISNIRPYLKKIWKASCYGGCSNDVLCFRTTTNTPSILYHLLRQDMFFDYVMSGVKGCKMPRGDKNQIMKWPVRLCNDWPQYESVLNEIDEKNATLNAETYKLIALRDSLLPILMSGELKISDLTC